MLSDDFTAKRAAAEEESDSSVSKKPKLEDDDEDTSMEEEDSDTDSGRAWSVDTEEKEDEGVVRSPRINYLNFPDPEPEWDKDSFDGYEYFNPEDRKSFSDEEEYNVFRDFKIKTWENRGFYEEDPFRSIFPLTDLEEPWIDMTTREYLESLASLCVKKLNEDRNSTVELVSIVRGNMKVGDGWKLYITFMAREHPGGPLVEYQAKAMDFGGKPPFPILCRPAPNIS